MASLRPKFHSLLLILTVAFSVLGLNLSAYAVSEKLVQEQGAEYLVYSNGSQEVFKVELQAKSTQEDTNLEASEEALFQTKRKSFSEKLVRFFTRKKDLKPGLTLVSGNNMTDAEIPDVSLPAETAKETKTSLYKKFLAPLISSLYLLGKNEKQVFMKKSELGLSFVVQAYGVAGASKLGGGKLLGLGLDLGFDMKTDRLFVSLYRTNGKFSAAASLPDAGFNLAGGIRSESKPDQSDSIVDVLLFKKMNFSVLKETRNPTKTTFTGIIPYTVISGEYNDKYANITGGLGMTLNPMPGLAEFDTDSKGYKIYVSSPLVLFQPMFTGMRNLGEVWERNFSPRSRGLRCHSIY